MELGGGTDAPAAGPVEPKKHKGTRYVILEEIEDKTFRILGEVVVTGGGQAARRQAFDSLVAERKDGDIGKLAAVPRSSWEPLSPKPRQIVGWE